MEKDVMLVATPEARRQLKIIAALTSSTMKEVLARLVEEEFKRLSPAPRGIEKSTVA